MGQGRVAPVWAKVMAIADYPQPKTKKELQRFWGLVGYYRSFCKNLSMVVFPLTELLNAKVKFHWSFERLQAFDNVKSLLCSSPVLAAPCFDRAFRLQVRCQPGGSRCCLAPE